MQSCKCCNIEWKGKREYNQHIKGKKIRGEFEYVKFECKLCNKLFKDDFHLRRHGEASQCKAKHDMKQQGIELTNKCKYCEKSLRIPKTVSYVYQRKNMHEKCYDKLMAVVDPMSEEDIKKLKEEFIEYMKTK